LSPMLAARRLVSFRRLALQKMSTSEGRNVDLTYNDLVDLISRKEIFIIDVRNPDELEKNGKYPTGINIPREFND